MPISPFSQHVTGGKISARNRSHDMISQSHFVAAFRAAKVPPDAEKWAFAADMHCVFCHKSGFFFLDFTSLPLTYVKTDVQQCSIISRSQ